MTNPFKRVIITREAERTRPWADTLRQKGIPVLEMPLLRFVSLEVDPSLLDQEFDWILLTSPQGVEAFLAAGLKIGNAQLGTLGQGTAQALKEAGCQDNLGITAKDGRELATAFVALAPEGSRVLLPGPRQRGPEVEEILSEAGYQVTTAPLYETVAISPDELPDVPFAEGDVVFFCSPSTVRAFCEKWDARPEGVAIGETTAAIMRQEDFATRVAESPNLEAMVQAAGLDLPEQTHSRESQS